MVKVKKISIRGEDMAYIIISFIVLELSILIAIHNTQGFSSIIMMIAVFVQWLVLCYCIAPNFKPSERPFTVMVLTIINLLLVAAGVSLVDSVAGGLSNITGVEADISSPAIYTLTFLISEAIIMIWLLIAVVIISLIAMLICIIYEAILKIFGFKR